MADNYRHGLSFPLSFLAPPVAMLVFDRAFFVPFLTSVCVIETLVSRSLIFPIFFTSMNLEFSALFRQNENMNEYINRNASYAAVLLHTHKHMCVWVIWSDLRRQSKEYNYIDVNQQPKHFQLPMCNACMYARVCAPYEIAFSSVCLIISCNLMAFLF